MSVESNHHCIFDVHEDCSTGKTIHTMLMDTEAENFDERAVVIEVITAYLVQLYTRGASDRTSSIYEQNEQVIETLLSLEPEPRPKSLSQVRSFTEKGLTLPLYLCRV
jgi:hypothetical protein